MGIPRESQGTLVEAGSCRESGEEFTTETFLPLGYYQQELPSRLQRRQTLRRAGFAGYDTAVQAMTKRRRIVLQNHPPRLVENQGEPPQPRDHPPDQAWGNDRLVVAYFLNAF